ncbi:hypothetical protein [Flagellimonas meridianipacifica]|uniref:Uncharacterized protein n=1 Tax=Flagellimonas meridianipacifica TaxID=1080225 RepID=A0A2T0MA50_9FLAO|nr:hypothetical protein [Allomuricauda pacifica]PRX54407.1 hypothetical protein CLV81_2808 [Allomuricauda pacifica]
MRKLLFLLITLLCFSGFSQERFKHRYRMKRNIQLIDNDQQKVKENKKKELEEKLSGLKKKLNGLEEQSMDYLKMFKEYKETVEFLENGTKNLMKDGFTPFESLDPVDKASLRKKLDLVKNNVTASTELLGVDGNKLTINKEQANNPDIEDFIGLSKPVEAELPFDEWCFGIKGIWCRCWEKKWKGNVLFEEDKLYFNPWNFKSGKYPDDKLPLYYKLEDGQTIKLNFQEITVTTLALPIKYRFRDDPIMVLKESEDGMEPMIEEREIPETFSTGINISLFGGYTFGSTKFNRRIKVKNREIVRKVTFGVLLGTGTETLKETNTDGTEEAPMGSDELTIGVASLGTGLVYSRNKLAIGLFYGWDFGVGSTSNTWNYDNRPWIGIGLGYDIFKL